MLLNTTIAAFCMANIGLVVLILVFQGGGITAYAEDSETQVQSENRTDIMETDGVLHTIPLDKIRYGGVPKDGIPSIDEPIFVNSTDADFVSGSDIVIGLTLGNETKAYPLFILVWHEIVNDNINGTSVAVTYCPLCYTSQVFERVVDEKDVEFGTTGKLYQSNLLMYDRLTDSYWSQALGMAVKGPQSGQHLGLVPFDLMTWGDWQTLYPDTVILGTDTGHIRAYGVDPYGSYYTSPGIWFPIDHHDPRMQPKEIVIGLGFNGTFKAYRQADLESEVVINDSIDSKDILLISMFEGNARVFDRTYGNNTLEFTLDSENITDTNTGSVWNYDGKAISGNLTETQLVRLPIEPGFWFSWSTFHPSTLVYGDP